MNAPRSRVAPDAVVSFRVRCYLRSSALMTCLTNMVKAAHQGVWLGLLDHEDRQALTQYHYSGARSDPMVASKYCDDAFNLSGLMSWEARVIEEYFRACRSILVGSAGGGREVLALSRRDVKIEAFECNPHLADYCRLLLKGQGADARVLGALPSRGPDDMDTYDGAVLGWCAYVHIIGRQTRIRLLNQFREHLEPGGPLLISFLCRKPAFSRLTYGIARSMRWFRRAEPPEQGDWIGSASGHYFTEDEIRTELTEAGFKTVFYSEEECGHAVATRMR